MVKKRKYIAYIKRDKYLQEIGFNSYQEYLNSDLWKSIRIRVFKKKGHICIGCNNQATILHHQVYSKSALEGRKGHIDSILPICASCHNKIEFSKDGCKLDMHDVHRELNKLRKNSK